MFHFYVEWKEENVIIEKYGIKQGYKKKETDGGWELTFKKGAGVGNVS